MTISPTIGKDCEFRSQQFHNQGQRVNCSFGPRKRSGRRLEPWNDWMFNRDPYFMACYNPYLPWVVSSPIYIYVYIYIQQIPRVFVTPQFVDIIWISMAFMYITWENQSPLFSKQPGGRFFHGSRLIFSTSSWMVVKFFFARTACAAIPGSCFQSHELWSKNRWNRLGEQ